jgi:hypothetical protein
MNYPRGRYTMVCLNLLLLALGLSAPASHLRREANPHLNPDTASSAPALDLRLQWVREYPPLKPAWPDQPKMQFDAAYHPVARGQTLFVG